MNLAESKERLEVITQMMISRDSALISLRSELRGLERIFTELYKEKKALETKIIEEEKRVKYYTMAGKFKKRRKEGKEANSPKAALEKFLLHLKGDNGSIKKDFLNELSKMMEDGKEV